MTRHERREMCFNSVLLMMPCCTPRLANPVAPFPYVLHESSFAGELLDICIDGLRVSQSFQLSFFSFAHSSIPDEPGSCRFCHAKSKEHRNEPQIGGKLRSRSPWRPPKFVLGSLLIRCLGMASKDVLSARPGVSSHKAVTGKNLLISQS